MRFDFPKNSPDLQNLVEALLVLCKKLPDDYSLVDADSKREDGDYVVKVHRLLALCCDNEMDCSAEESLERMEDKALAIVGETESLRPEVRELVQSFREKMTRWQSVKEWSFASLDTIALVGSLSYVVATGDAFTGGTLMSMFGLNDLVAIPALSAFIAANAKVDEKMVDARLKGLFTIWAKGKADKIRSVLEAGITGCDIAACDKKVKQLDAALCGLKTAIAEARQQADVVFGNRPEDGK